MDSENLFLLIKSLHIFAVISWLVGLLYLPRLFVYHAEVKPGSETDQLLQIMELRLLRYIMNPAMIAVFLFGGILVYFIGFDFLWLHIKITLVLLLAIFHAFLARCRRNFASGNNKHSKKFYRTINEIPSLIMLCIILLVIFKP